MIAEYIGTVPRRGDRVGITEHSGSFEVVDVNTLMQTANLKSEDENGHIARNIPWILLKYQSTSR